jgi:hypothetical protein
VHKKQFQTIAIVIFAIFGRLPLSRPMATVINNLFPHTLITEVFIEGMSFALAYLGIWLLFNKWSARFWIKAVIASGIIILSFVAIQMYDISAAYNMTHPK